MMPILLFVGAALAAGLHSGIPVRQRDLGEPAFQSVENGWTAPLADGQGFVRVYVGRDEAEAIDWFERTRQAFSRAIPDYIFADQGAGDGVGVVLFRDGNVGVMVRSEAGEARSLAESLRARIVDGVPGLYMPMLKRTEDGWTVMAPGAIHVDVRGGGNIPFATTAAGGVIGNWAVRPEEITVWDAFGRGTVLK